MLNKTVTCDKCKKDITDLGRYEVIIKNNHHDNPMYEFDFCESCYGDFIRTVGSWLKNKEKQNDKGRI